MACSLPQRTVGTGTAAITGAEIAYGTMSLAGGLNVTSLPSEDESIQLLRHCLSRGLNIISTSELYGKGAFPSVCITGFPRVARILAPRSWSMSLRCVQGSCTRMKSWSVSTEELALSIAPCRCSGLLGTVTFERLELDVCR